MHFAQTSAAVHFCWLTAHLYAKHLSTGVIALTQACCEPVLQSTTIQWRMHFAHTSAAVHFCSLTEHLYEEQISIGLSAVTEACCEPVLQSSTEQWRMHLALCCPVLQCISVRFSSLEPVPRWEQGPQGNHPRTARADLPWFHKLNTSFPDLFSLRSNRRTQNFCHVCHQRLQRKRSQETKPMLRNHV